MKFAVVFLAALGLASAAPRPRNSVNNDDPRPAFNDLLANIDLVRLAQLLPQLAQTQDGKEFLAYVQGPKFRAAIDAVKAEPTTEKLIAYLESNGLENFREVIRMIAEALGIKPNPSAIGTKNFSDLIGETVAASTRMPRSFPISFVTLERRAP